MYKQYKIIYHFITKKTKYERARIMSQPQLQDGINTKSIALIATAINNVDAAFPAKAFKRMAGKNLNTLELKDRVDHIIDAMHHNASD